MESAMRCGSPKIIVGALVASAVALSISACAVYSPEPQYGYGNGGYYSSYNGGNNWHGGHVHGGWHDGDDHDGGRP